MRLRIPGIKLDSDGKYKLFCGWCGSTDVELREVQKDIYGNSLFTVYCKNHCNAKVKGKDNVVCSIPNIKEIADRDCNGDINIYYKMIIDVYRLLKFDLYLPKEFRGMRIEKELVTIFNIKQISDIKLLGEENNGLGSLRYACIIKDKQYLIKVKIDGNIYVIDAEKFKKYKGQWQHVDGKIIK